MASYYFPQLSSGAVAQYPFRRARVFRTITNSSPSGDLVLAPDTGASRMIWQLGYASLSGREANILTNFFDICQGRLRAFTFIDPAENMLTSSSDFSNGSWQNLSSIRLVPNSSDPLGGDAAFVVTNNGQTNEELTQTIAVPANYQYCFSLYARSDQTASIELIRRGSGSQNSSLIGIGPNWSRAACSGALSDQDVGLTVAIRLAPGQQVWLYGPQLEPQIQPSRYRPTQNRCGVYPNAHWTVDTLPLQAIAPDEFATTFTLEANL
jgi:hypothetical protein